MVRHHSSPPARPGKPPTRSIKKPANNEAKAKKVSNLNTRATLRLNALQSSVERVLRVLAQNPSYRDVIASKIEEWRRLNEDFKNSVSTALQDSPEIDKIKNAKNDKKLWSFIEGDMNNMMQDTFSFFQKVGFLYPQDMRAGVTSSLIESYVSGIYDTRSQGLKMVLNQTQVGDITWLTLDFLKEMFPELGKWYELAGADIYTTKAKDSKERLARIISVAKEISLLTKHLPTSVASLEVTKFSHQPQQVEYLHVPSSVHQTSSRHEHLSAMSLMPDMFAPLETPTMPVLSPQTFSSEHPLPEPAVSYHHPYQQVQVHPFLQSYQPTVPPMCPTPTRFPGMCCYENCNSMNWIGGNDIEMRQPSVGTECGEQLSAMTRYALAQNNPMTSTTELSFLG